MECPAEHAYEIVMHLAVGTHLRTGGGCVEAVMETVVPLGKALNPKLLCIIIIYYY